MSTMTMRGQALRDWMAVGIGCRSTLAVRPIPSHITPKSTALLEILFSQYRNRIMVHLGRMFKLLTVRIQYRQLPPSTIMIY